MFFHPRGHTSFQVECPFSTADQLVLQVPQSVIEGDTVIMSCWGNEEEELDEMIYHKDGKNLMTFKKNSSFIIVNANSRSNGMYGCTVSGEDDIFWRRNSNVVEVRVQDLFLPPKLTARPPRLIEGSSVVLTCETQLHPQKLSTRLEFCFFKGNLGLEPCRESPELKIPAMWRKDSGSYRCLAKTQAFRVSKQSQEVIIQVQRIPVSGVFLEIWPPTGQVFEGENVVLVCTVTTGTGDIEFSWYKGKIKKGVVRASQNSQRVELQIVIKKYHAGEYYCAANNGFGLISSTRVYISVKAEFMQEEVKQKRSSLTSALSLPVPVSQPVLTLRTARTPAVEGDVMELLCQAQTGSPPILYLFYHNDAILGNSSSFSGREVSFNLSLTSRHSGNYSCEATNGRGAQQSNIVSINITGPPEDMLPFLAAGVTGGLLGFLAVAVLLYYVWFRRKSGTTPGSQEHTNFKSPVSAKELEPVYSSVNPDSEDVAGSQDVVYSQVWSIHQKQEGAGTSDFSLDSFYSLLSSVFSPFLPKTALFHSEVQPRTSARSTTNANGTIGKEVHVSGMCCVTHEQEPWAEPELACPHELGYDP
ncbi:PREDICTED: Fc receptor-like protein 2-like [Elephantulus edwardii]|uniref:Fc receptor-like protein 2-like n=1 Tax=Elephantulus edwardii TaxID=28737 RepID=UPI0003F0C26C|nr:PREDICTED: Fc receptor-like protein 2-like [Elephantulus edwardii]